MAEAKKKKWILILLLIAGAWWLGRGCGRETPPPDAPLVERVELRNAEERYRYVEAEDLLDWAREETPISVVRTAEDALPNKLALSMMPIFVDWEKSGDGSYLVHNVNVGGNPVKGINVMASVRIPADGIADVQFIMCVGRNAKGKDTAFGHGQLRFVFNKNARPVILGRDGNPLPEEAELDDLVFSWEAWRPPRTPYGYLEGLDPSAYAMTVRCYAGAQRFLTDVLRNSPWECYPIKLPDVKDAKQDLLYTCLMIGDGLGRRTIQSMVEDGQLDPPSEKLAELSESEWEAVRTRLAADRVPDDPLAGIMGEADLSYHLVLRSCITMSLTAVDLALARTYHKNDLGDRPHLKVAPEELPDWMEELATADKAGVLARLPATLYFVAKNQTVLPGNAYMILQDAGLLYLNDDGTPVKHRYSRETVTPYGKIKDNML